MTLKKMFFIISSCFLVANLFCMDEENSSKKFIEDNKLSKSNKMRKRKGIAISINRSPKQHKEFNRKLDQYLKTKVVRDAKRSELIDAITERNFNRVAKVIESGMNVNFFHEPDSDYTPLLLAVESLELDIVKLLIKAGAKKPANDDLWEALFGEGSISNLEKPENFEKAKAMAEYFISEGFSVNAVISDNGLTPLHSMAIIGHLGFVQYLIEKGADINAEMKNGFTPLALARKGYLENGGIEKEQSYAVMSYLVQKKADLGSTQDVVLKGEKRGTHRERPRFVRVFVRRRDGTSHFHLLVPLFLKKDPLNKLI